MAVQLSSHQIPQRLASGSVFPKLEDRVTEVAERLRQRSQELRASSKSLQLRSAEIMSRASELSMLVMDYDVQR